MTSETDSARLARMEGKLDAALAAHAQRLEAGEQSRARLHERVDGLDTQVSHARAGVHSLTVGIRAVTAVLTLVIAGLSVWVSWIA